MSFVLDASITACWALPDETDDRAVRALRTLATDEAIVPSLWWFEVRNILAVNERRRRISSSDSDAFLLRLSSLPIRVEPVPDDEEVLRLAREHTLSVYDAAYLELAKRERVPLATLDEALSKAARREHVPLVS